MSIPSQLSIPILKDMLVCWLFVFMAEFTVQCKRHMMNAFGGQKERFLFLAHTSFFLCGPELGESMQKEFQK